jgi:hypothetical protein
MTLAIDIVADIFRLAQPPCMSAHVFETAEMR